MTALRARALRIALSLAVWLAMIVFLVRQLEALPDREVWAELGAPSGLASLAAFGACFLAALVLRAVRFGVLVRRVRALSWRDIAPGFFWIFLLGAVTPFRLGEAYRAVWLKRMGGEAAAGVGLWAGERITDLLTLLLFLFIGLAAAPQTPDYAAAPLALVAAGAVLAYLTVWTRGRALTSWLHRRGAPGVVVNTLQVFDYMKDARAHAFTVLITLVIWAIMATGFWAGLHFIAPASPISPLAALLAVSAVNLAALMSGAPANLGSFQAAFIAAVALYAAPVERAFVASVGVQLTGLAIAVVAGIAGWMLSRRA
ncbi:hypothetical protein AY599_02150 [Leptolyngbya valderiana BDU 20041]|nr:hypothetical protein AY599_02150 [Leptolyngbya valderiana BDU 20041]